MFNKKVYGLLHGQIEGITPGYDYKGSVSTTSNLPSDATTGDLYTVTGEGNAQFVYDGTSWIQIYSQIASNAQIDGLYS